MSIFTDRVLGLIEERGISKNKLLGDIGVGKNSMVNWISRGNIPSAEVVNAIAEYFDVSVDYLLGNTQSPHEDMEITDEEREFLEIYKKAKASDKSTVQSMLKIIDELLGEDEK